MSHSPNVFLILFLQEVEDYYAGKVRRLTAKSDCALHYAICVYVCASLYAGQTMEAMGNTSDPIGMQYPSAGSRS